MGLLPGDQIVNVEGETIAGIGIKNTEIIKKLKGPKGTSVNIDVKRKSSAELLDFEIARDKIKIESVVAAYMANKNTGYLKVTRFAGNTSSDFIAAIEKLKQQGAKNLVVDLRGNPGGYLGAATAMVDQFLADGELITYTQGRSRKRDDYKASGDGIFKQGKLVVLINEGSASASEIFSGAIQDLDRGLIVGTRSHGKGLVQEPIELKDGSQLRLTVARYYTPSGRCIQRPYDMSIKNGERDSLAKVFTTKGGREVMDGGGIIPDIDIDADSVYSNAFYQGVLRKALLYELALNYYNANLQLLETEYSNYIEFASDFKVPNAVIDSCGAILKRQRIEFTNTDKIKAEAAINGQFKAMIGRYIWGDDAFYMIINNTDASMQKALDALVNNASSFYNTEIGNLTNANWDDLVGNNLKAPLFLINGLKD
ncbi:MAG: S41 family peptidase, partial [Bacteroidia bacterium]